MLVVLEGLPVAAPGEAMGLEEFICRVVFIYFVGKITVPVCIGLRSRRGDPYLSVWICDIGIVKGVDVYGEPKGML